MNAVVKTRRGEVRGKGVPYAAPLFGTHRLQLPQPVDPWSGLRNVLTYGPKTPQPPYPPVEMLLLESAISDEDCPWICRSTSGGLDSCRTRALPVVDPKTKR